MKAFSTHHAYSPSVSSLGCGLRLCSFRLLIYNAKMETIQPLMQHHGGSGVHSLRNSVAAQNIIGTINRKVPPLYEPSFQPEGKQCRHAQGAGRSRSGYAK